MKENSDDDTVDMYNLPYRRGVGIMLLNKANYVFVGKRVDAKSDSWQMPQGGIKEDETIVEAGLRELYEETNIKDVKIIAQTSHWLYYDMPEFFLGKVWEGRYRGQKQKWLLATFCGNDSSINITKLPAEFQDWKWVDFNQLLEVAVPYKRNLYITILNEFRCLIGNAIPP